MRMKSFQKDIRKKLNADCREYDFELSYGIQC